MRIAEIRYAIRALLHCRDVDRILQSFPSFLHTSVHFNWPPMVSMVPRSPAHLSIR